MYKYFIILSILPVLAYAINCKSEDDGNYEIGCKSYVQCKNGTKKTFYCKTKQAYHKEKGICDEEDKVPAPCNVMRDCSDLPNGRYANTDDKCNSYYTCLEGSFYGHNFCPLPLVFNEMKGICNYKRRTLPPCGTADPKDLEDEEENY